MTYARTETLIVSLMPVRLGAALLNLYFVALISNLIKLRLEE